MFAANKFIIKQTVNLKNAWFDSRLPHKTKQRTHSWKQRKFATSLQEVGELVSGMWLAPKFKYFSEHLNIRLTTATWDATHTVLARELGLQ